MVPFHYHWLQGQFKEENMKAIKERLLAREEKKVEAGHWLTELVNELYVSPDSPPKPKFYFER